jgi:HNH endonuclease
MPSDIQLCPYCGVRPRNSDDHIFPEFLGGKTTVRACKSCNDLFGHTFEGPVSNDFAPVVVTLRRGGLRPPRRAVWKHAIKKEGVDYDLDSDLQLSPSDPSIERDAEGSVKRAVFASLRAARSFIRGQEAQGRKLKSTPQTIEGTDIRKLEFKLKIGREVRRLANSHRVS